MGLADASKKWLRVIDAVSTLAIAAKSFRDSKTQPDTPARVESAPLAQLGQIEARLAGVVVAALKEAFDRDRARLDLERSHLEAERQRAEAALQLEVQRQAADRALFQVRLVAVISFVAWVVTAMFLPWLPGLRTPVPKAVLGAGWMSLVAALGCAFVAHASISKAAGSQREASGDRLPASAAVLPWLLMAGLALSGVSLLLSL